MSPSDKFVRLFIVGVSLLFSGSLPILIGRLSAGQEEVDSAPLRDRAPTVTDTPVRSHVPVGAAPTSTSRASLATKPPTETPDPFQRAHVDGVTQLADGRSMIRLIVPGLIVGEYDAIVTVWRPQQFDCFIPDDSVHRLYCVGPHLPYGIEGLIEIIDMENPSQDGAPIVSLSFVVQQVAMTATDPPPDRRPAPPPSTKRPTSTLAATAPATSTPTATQASSLTITPTVTLPPSTPTPTEEEAPDPTETPEPTKTTEPTDTPTD